MGDSFDRGYRERGYTECENTNNWSAMAACCNSADSIGALSSSYTVVDGVSSNIETRFDGLENSIKALSKQMENIKFSAKDVGAALKKVSDKLSNGRRSLRSELKTLRGNGRYV